MGSITQAPNQGTRADPVNELRERNRMKIQAKIVQEIETLKRVMHYIEAKLNDITPQYRLLAILFRSEQQRSLHHLKVTMDDVKAMLGNLTSRRDLVVVTLHASGDASQHCHFLRP
ncbi:hypothetical protein C0991_005910 [Blastosporella zonata]|nr:hypothetical protein C0991_005910 [Blastosporella zonata]